MPFVIEPSCEIAARIDFPLLCNARGVTQAVEVGVDLGWFAGRFLERWDGRELLLVDPYAPYPEMPWDRTGDLVTAAVALAPHHGRYRFVRAGSGEAAAALPSSAPWFRPGFVYVDAAHDRDSVLADLGAWWPLVRPGGILAGHDFDDTHPGVVAAVTEFAAARGLVVRTTHEAECRSWYVYKGEPEQLIMRYFRQGERQNPHAGGPH